MSDAEQSATRSEDGSVTESGETDSRDVAASGETRKRGPRDKEGVVGRVLNGKYRVIEIIARGGMGAVYRAEQLPLGRPVALKLIHSALDDDHPDSEFQKRFFLEAASCAKLTHPNIVVIHDFGEIELSPERRSAYMAMELLDGTTLHDVLKVEAPLTYGRSLRVTREIARALREAHRQEMVHRDLKPTNVMLSRTSDGESVKVLDFGLVKLLRDDSEQLTREDLFMGSPKYMAPEQVERVPIDGRADLYALGVLLYQMLSGRVPFDGEHQVQTLMAHVRDAPPTLPPAVPEAIVAITMRLLEKRPDDRFASADALITEVDRVMATLGADADRRADPSTMTQAKETTISKRLRHEANVQLAAAPLLATPTPAITAAPESEVAPEPSPKGAPATPSADTAPPSRGLLWAGAIGLLGLGLVAAALAWSSAGDEPRARPEPIVPTTTRETTTAPTPAEPQAFNVFIASTPPGAEVLRGTERIGTTPTFSRITPDELSHGGITFRVVLEGHVPYSWTQGASSEDVHVDAALETLTITALPPTTTETAVVAEPTTPTHTGRTGTGGTGRRPPHTTRERPPEDDLRTRR